ncbi:MAG TPA: IPT/TIG domain-containing protein [Bryobacteraceae bacterium]|nr:IPT/TIG domain-containing protein [Bryobacteraceae bacterium]
MNIVLLLAFFASGVRPAPVYSPESVVNAASNRAGPVAPNTIVSVYGQDLAFVTRALTGSDIRDNTLPTALGATGVRVTVGGILAPILFVSPTQVNLLVPNLLLPGPTEITVMQEGKSGPAVPIQLVSSSPALFQSSPEFVVASDPSGALFTSDRPALPGTIVILYATGLGTLEHEFPPGQLINRASRLKRWREFRVQLDGRTVEPENLHYVGAAPGFAGVYQINFVVPSWTPIDPEIRVGLDEELSPSGLKISVRPQ